MYLQLFGRPRGQCERLVVLYWNWFRYSHITLLLYDLDRFQIVPPKPHFHVIQHLVPSIWLIHFISGIWIIFLSLPPVINISLELAETAIVSCDFIFLYSTGIWGTHKILHNYSFGIFYTFIFWLHCFESSSLHGHKCEWIDCKCRSYFLCDFNISSIIWRYDKINYIKG